MHCHCGQTATHYYDTVGRGRVHLCDSHANQFGYPQYLVPLVKPGWRPEYGYLIVGRDGSGIEHESSLTWPFEGEQAEWWLKACGVSDAYLLVCDAAWEPYRAHYSSAPEFKVDYECRRVTVLPVL